MMNQNSIPVNQIGEVILVNNQTAPREAENPPIIVNNDPPVDNEALNDLHLSQNDINLNINLAKK